MGRPLSPILLIRAGCCQSLRRRQALLRALVAGMIVFGADACIYKYHHVAPHHRTPGWPCSQGTAVSTRAAAASNAFTWFTDPTDFTMAVNMALAVKQSISFAARSR
jgi:hypothetical protein